jgi:hypothetical protein
MSVEYVSKDGMRKVVIRQDDNPGILFVLGSDPKDNGMSDNIPEEYQECLEQEPQETR